MRYLLVLAASSLVTYSSACGEEYLLRLERVGYINAPTDGTEPVETVLHSIEVIAQVGQRFHAKTTIGGETIVFRGELKPWKGDFSVRCEYLNTWPSNTPHAKVNLPNTISVLGGTDGKLGKPGMIAGSAKISTKGGVERTEEKWRLQVTVTKYSPVPLEPAREKADLPQPAER